MDINGEAAPGVSSGEAMKEIEKLVAQLPPGYSVDWTGESYQERAAGAQTPLLYTLSLIVVFLCLAALYESWSIPTAILLAVPLGRDRRGAGHGVARPGARHLFPGRDADHHRPGEQERDPDRRVRQGVRRGRQERRSMRRCMRCAIACGRS